MRAAFSRELAAELCRSLGAGEPEHAAAGLVSPCEGLVFDRVIGAGSLDSPRRGTRPAGNDWPRPCGLPARGPGGIENVYRKHRDSVWSDGDLGKPPDFVTRDALRALGAVGGACCGR
ncbi:hypothetical protein GCM10009854_40350 [Saccharopolyspora halophila]|uniref:Uncharacterized protein n=1 Tax=Saccharopolyspora halophila TaxID=405551 RepID=A0ABN3GQ01_9PSEU